MINPGLYLTYLTNVSFSRKSKSNCWEDRHLSRYIHVSTVLNKKFDISYPKFWIRNIKILCRGQYVCIAPMYSFY